MPTGTYKRGIPLEERFWSKVQRSLFGCWEWTANTYENGYGLIRVKRKTTRAHRLSWELKNGPVPAGMYVLHKCDNRLCVRPSHLFIGTQNDNIKDAVEKGRMPRGSQNHQAILSEDKVKEARKLFRKHSLKYLCKKYGVAKSTLSQAISGKHWRHI